MLLNKYMLRKISIAHIRGRLRAVPKGTRRPSRPNLSWIDGVEIVAQ